MRLGTLSRTTRKHLVQSGHPRASLSLQCRLLGLCRSTLYYRPPAPDPDELALMRRLDELYTTYPFYGSRQMSRHLVAMMDWASRCVLAWELSNTLDSEFCVLAVEEALEAHPAPEIFNTDQGASSPRRRSRAAWKGPGCGSRWTVEGAGWTLCSSSGCGARSSTKRCICRSLRTGSRPGS